MANNSSVAFSLLFSIVYIASHRIVNIVKKLGLPIVNYNTMSNNFMCESVQDYC